MAGMPVLRSFVSEKELEEVKKKKQEEWERVRKPDQPLERPEEAYDGRTLYHKLKEQKDRKQEEWDDQHKFKNMIYKGLDGDESQFLKFVAERQADHEEEMHKQEIEEVTTFREAVAKLEDDEQLASLSSGPPKLPSPMGTDKSAPSSKLVTVLKASKVPKSQLSLLSASIKTKRKRRSTSSEEDVSKKGESVDDSEVLLPQSQKKQKLDQDLPVTAVLPGLAAYSSSSEESDAE